jgi:hypothetical protein
MRFGKAEPYRTEGGKAAEGFRRYLTTLRETHPLSRGGTDIMPCVDSNLPN